MWRSRGDAQHLEHEVHADAEVASPNENGVGIFHLLLDFMKVSMPSGGADNEGKALGGAMLDVLERGFRSGEVDGDVEVGSNGRACEIIGASDGADFVTTLCRDLRSEAAGLSATDDKHLHANTAGSTSEKNLRWSWVTARGTSDSSMTKLMFISEAPCEIMRMSTSSMA